MASIVPIPTESYNLGFIGAGKMAESIARGVVKSGVLPASQIRTAHLATARRTAFESFGAKVLSHNIELKPLLSEKQLLVSVVAGVKLKDLQEWAGHSRFIRVMPNTPAAVGVAASAIEALADGGVAAGLPRDLALGLASQTVLGAASMAVNVGKHPGQLKDDVASPGGTTIAGIHELKSLVFANSDERGCCCC
ncbi:hypothetical protein DH2020_044753 [Rehmannia glutinosa]|uniref:Pyrroline-5-carboxylate reductase n=1 Tax=Rehmannia glutinosa TaxID=99300 RepID=A0ABR0UG28_REHGL